MLLNFFSQRVSFAISYSKYNEKPHIKTTDSKKGGFSLIKGGFSLIKGGFSLIKGGFSLIKGGFSNR